MDNENKNNKVLLIGALLIALVFAFTLFKSEFKRDGNSKTASETKKEISNYSTISAEDLESKMSKNNDLQIIDIRSYDEYQMEHIANSININSPDFSASVSPEKETIIVGPAKDNGEISSAYNSLKAKKFNAVSVLVGGMESWKKAEAKTISIGNPNSFLDQSKVSFVNAEDVKKAIDDAGYFKFILDVRTKQAFDSGHIQGAVNIPLDDLEKSQNQIPIGKEIFVYGNTETQSFQGGVRLHDLGYLAVSALKGGFTSWTQKEFPIEK